VILAYYFFCNLSCDLSTLLDSDLAEATYTSAVLLASQGQPVTISDSESGKSVRDRQTSYITVFTNLKRATKLNDPHTSP